MPEYCDIAIRAAVEAGKILSENYGKIQSVSQKESLRDIVTTIDKLSEQTVIEIIQKLDPNTPILSEESGLIGSESDRYWIVDALDGTVNYVHQIPHFCVSIGLIEDRRAVAGAIYNPLSNDLFYGSRELGVFKNQSPIRIKDCSLGEALIGMAFSGKSYDSANRDDEFLLFGRLNDCSRGCLRPGSAGMNLSYLAEGKFNVCLSKANKFWDVAPGLLFAELAGAKISLKHLEQSHLVSYVASVPGCWDELCEIVPFI